MFYVSKFKYENCFYQFIFHESLVVDPPGAAKQRGVSLFFFFFLFSQAVDGRLARAEKCGGWQEARGGLLRKTKRKKIKRRRKRKEISEGAGFFGGGAEIGIGCH